MSDKKTPVGDGASLEFDGSNFIVTSDKYADVLTIAPMDYIIQLTRQCDYWKAEAERLHLALSEIAKPALGGSSNSGSRKMPSSAASHSKPNLAQNCCILAVCPF